MTVSDSDRVLSRGTMFADRRTVITVTGALDAGNAPDLERMAADNVDANTDVLVLELSAVAAFDQAALDALLRVRTACEARSVLLHVVPSDVVRAVLTSTETAF